MSRNSRIDDALTALYDRVPSVACDGRCAALCCKRPVEQSSREYQAAPIGTEGADSCPHLGADARCWVYERRPMLCRLWGATETLPCPYGCETDQPPLTDEQEFALFVYSLAIGGGARVGWPETFDPERVMAAYRADAGQVRTRFLAGRQAAREATSLAAQDQRAPVPRPAT